MKNHYNLLTFNGKNIAISQCLEIEKTEDYLKLKKECDKNSKQLLDDFNSLVEEIKILKTKVRILELDIAYDRGQITKEEYEYELGR